MQTADTYSSPQEALSDIRGLMSRSGRFLSLSGLSGVWAGACALAATAYAYAAAGLSPLSGVPYHVAYYRQFQGATAVTTFLALVGAATIAVAVAGAAFFTLRRARRGGYALWDATSRAMLLSMLAPLAAGGALVLAHWYQGVYGFAAALTLVFYGLALLAGSRYTHDELRALGYCEIALGLATAFFPGYGIDAWALGFGVLHVAYGLLMWSRHERQAA